jgi:ATP-dependent exoDNAse (exonuclease V) alpha subunit
VLGECSLGDDQREAVRGLLTGGERVALLVGPAGAGKSRALGAAREACELAGYEVIGLAPSAMAAAALSGQAGLRGETLAKFLLENSAVEPAGRLDERSVVVLERGFDGTKR